MFVPFLVSAARSPSRQQLIRSMAALHIAILSAVMAWLAIGQSPRLISMLGDAHVLLGIAEGALIVGWRLTQWPKSQALEPLLLANVSSRRVMAGEQLVGLGWLAILSASGVPLLIACWGASWLPAEAVVLLPMQGMIWGAVVGFGLVAWAYERPTVRRWGERVCGALLTVYFVLGGLAGEHTLELLRSIPWVGNGLVEGIWWMHTSHPFAGLHRWEAGDAGGLAALLRADAAGVLFVALFLFRSAQTLERHYVDRHYQPPAEQFKGRRSVMGEDALSWWAVRRVHEYAGRVNLYLAGGAALLYSAYLVLGPHWPAWLGNRIFIVFEQGGGVATIGTLLVLLSAVPAAYQYGLWDSSKTDRCRRLESLLTTDLDALDFERASWSASWSRGRGYFYSAIVLWMAAGFAGRMDGLQVLTAMAAAWLLVIVYFLVGFRQLATTGGGTTAGFLLCVVMPLATWFLARSGAEPIARLLPPGVVYYAVADPASPTGLLPWFLFALLGASMIYLKRALRRFDVDIRRSFEADLLRGA